MRICRTCNQSKQEESFNTIHSTYKTPTGDLIQYTHYRKDCRDCHAIKKYKQELIKKYNLTIEQYQELLKSQDNKCASCKKPFLKTPFVDHCHRTGKTRGLLCSNCNFGIGQFNDDP